MNSLAKKITLLALLGIIQIGFTAGMTEASPLHLQNDSSAQVQFYNGPGGPGHDDQNGQNTTPPPKHEEHQDHQDHQHHWWDL